MTWNVFWRWGGDWRERAPGILDTLRVYRPDVLGLTETWAGDGTSQPDQIAADLGMVGVFARTSLPPEPDPVEEPGQIGIQMGIGLVSRWPVRATEVHDLPHDQRGGPAPTALLATLDHPRGPLHVIVTCLEWEPAYAADQLAQASAVARLAAEPRLDGPLPVLVLGDLNAPVEQPEIAPLADTLIDTFAAGGGDPAAKTVDSAIPHAPVEVKHLIDRRIDHIFARSGRAGHAVTVAGAFIAGDRPVGGCYPSDHYAVGVDLEP
ncbi:MAG TPA: endonuclease/exonuclease/phosphatase family protein [Actinoplanes sp.]|nr:endonuclease/exonuclease/phosphatase family protein [Actinoplanes sp.]